jgi:DNA-directed RNA polymerase subunit RPC12/RpoP
MEEFTPENITFECQRCGVTIVTSKDEETGYRILRCPACHNRILKRVKEDESVDFSFEENND